MKIYASSYKATQNLLAEAIIANAIAKEGVLADDQMVAFTPDLETASFDILSGPVAGVLVIQGKSFDLNIAPNDGASIAMSVSEALQPSSEDIMKGTSPSNSKKPKK